MLCNVFAKKYIKFLPFQQELTGSESRESHKGLLSLKYYGADTKEKEQRGQRIAEMRTAASQ